MPSLIGRLSQLASSPKGRELVDKAKRYADSPEGRRKIEQVRGRVAKRK